MVVNVSLVDLVYGFKISIRVGAFYTSEINLIVIIKAV